VRALPVSTGINIVIIILAIIVRGGGAGGGEFADQFCASHKIFEIIIPLIGPFGLTRAIIRGIVPPIWL
jgi:hypothetical protein